MNEKAMPDQNRTGILQATDFSADGTPMSVNDDVAQVMQFVRDAEAFVVNNKHKAGWEESDMLYQSPRPFSTFSSSYIMEPNVRRFTVAKDVNSIVPQFYKGLLYDDPPFMLKPSQGATKEIADLKKDIMSAFLTKMKFQREIKRGMEQQVLLGTGIWQYGIKCEEEEVKKRLFKKVEVPNSDTPIFSDERPKIESTTVLRYWPFLESIDIGKIYVDPKLSVPDISEAAEVAKQRYVNYYDLLELKKDPSYDGLQVEDEVIKGWFNPGQPVNAPLGQIASATQNNGMAMHSQQPAIEASNPLMNKMSLIEYWNGAETKTVLNGMHLIRKMDNPWKKVPFLSANYWNIRENFWGFGVGIIGGSDQRVQQGTIGSALKLLQMKTNAPYLRNADANMPSQTIQTGLGRVLSVSDPAKAYKVMETPDVPADLWNALASSKAESESATGADQMLVGGSSSGPRTSMGRTAGGASILAGASATRLDGPLDNFIDQVFVPFLYILDAMIKEYVSDRQIADILGKRRGQDFIADLEHFHDYEADYDVLAGAKLAARAAMAQSLVLIFQLLNNPQIQANIADINGEIVDFKPLVRTLFECSQWGSGIENDIFKPMTPQQKQQHDAQNGAAVKMQQAMAINNQKFAQKQQLLDQETDNRIKEQITRDSFKAAGLSEAVTGSPTDDGFGGDALQQF
jgi:hypothetical protein